MSLVIGLAGGMATMPSFSMELTIVTANFRPLQYLVNDRLQGYAVETVEQMIAMIRPKYPDTHFRYEIMPWKRALVTSTRDKPVLFYSLSRTAEREERYHWIGETSPYIVAFVKLAKNKDLTATTIPALMQQSKKIGVQRGSNAESMLMDMGYDEGQDFMTYTHFHDGMRMLFFGRIDVMPLTTMFYRNNACKIGLNGDEMQTLFEIKELSNPLWLVANKATPDDWVADLRQAHRQLTADGTIDAIQARYMKEWTSLTCAEAAQLP